MTKKKFESKCNEIAAEVGVTVDFIDDERPDREVEDDGTLHVIRTGTRAMFDVSFGQSLRASEQNRRTREVLKGLGVKEIGASVLVDDEDEENVCPHCGKRID